MLFKILNDIRHHNIHIFQNPTYENEDEEALAEHEEIAVRVSAMSGLVDTHVSHLAQNPFRCCGFQPASHDAR